MPSTIMPLPVLAACSLLLAAALESGCGGGSSTDSPADTRDDTDDTDVVDDTDHTDDTDPVGFGDLEPGVWSFLPVDGMMCADASDTGIGVNPGTSNELVFVLYMQHACYSETSCAPGWVDRLLFHGYDANDLRSTASALDRFALLDRDDTSSPLRDATWVYVPECSGDLYAGDKDNVYEYRERDEVAYFRGDRNMVEAIELVAHHVPRPDRVWGVGLSMGGFGIQLQADRFATAWPDAERAFLADSAPMLPVGLRSRAINGIWGLRHPESCEDCDALFTAPLRHQLALQPDARFGLIAFRDDEYLRREMSRRLSEDYPTRLNTLVDDIYTTPQAAAFVIDAEGHLGMRSAETARTASGAELGPWLRAWASGGEGFQTER